MYSGDENCLGKTFRNNLNICQLEKHKNIFFIKGRKASVRTKVHKLIISQVMAWSSKPNWPKGQRHLTLSCKEFTPIIVPNCGTRSFIVISTNSRTSTAGAFQRSISRTTMVGMEERRFLTFSDGTFKGIEQLCVSFRSSLVICHIHNSKNQTFLLDS